MSNWYRNAKGRVVAPTPFRNDDYWCMTRATKLDDYNVRTLSSAGTHKGLVGEPS
jgi:4-hydroxyacetophenone monooxygenase